MISVIICTYNRDKYIYNVLKSLALNNISVEAFEIILINNNSTDNTEVECHRFMREYPLVRMLYFIETNQGLSNARNRGIKEANGDILVYVDDDALVNEEYLKSYAEFFKNNKGIEAAGGAIIPKYETKTPNWMSHYTKNLVTGYLYYGNKTIEFTKGKYPGGGNAAYRKDVFNKVGFFNVDLGRKGDSLVGAEEKDIFDKMNKMGMRFYYIPDAILYHLIPEKKLSKDYFNRLTYSIGKSEYMRTNAISKSKYFKRLMSEGIKWGASIILCLGYTFSFQAQKGLKLITFRYNVSKGLLGF
jgi:glucosyl-dolichyl phosphate glucuronosyltransferase